MSNKVNLFLIGAAKSGTTALAASLAKHPAIAPLPIKEPGHFSTDLRTPVFSSRYNRLLQWDEASYFKRVPLEERHIGFVESESNYQKLVDQTSTKQSDHKYVLDALHPCAIKHTRNQNTHIMITLENMILRKSPQIVSQRLSHPAHVKRTAKALRRKPMTGRASRLQDSPADARLRGFYRDQEPLAGRSKTRVTGLAAPMISSSTAR